MELNDHSQMAGVAFADIRLEVSAEKARSALGQIELNSLDARTHPFRVSKCARNVLIALSRSFNCDNQSIAESACRRITQQLFRP